MAAQSSPATTHVSMWLTEARKQKFREKIGDNQEAFLLKNSEYYYKFIQILLPIIEDKLKNIIFDDEYSDSCNRDEITFTLNRENADELIAAISHINYDCCCLWLIDYFSPYIYFEFIFKNIEPSDLSDQYGSISESKISMDNFSLKIKMYPEKLLNSKTHNNYICVWMKPELISAIKLQIAENKKNQERYFDIFLKYLLEYFEYVFENLLNLVPFKITIGESNKNNTYTNNISPYTSNTSPQTKKLLIAYRIVDPQYCLMRLKHYFANSEITVEYCREDGFQLNVGDKILASAQPVTFYITVPPHMLKDGTDIPSADVSTRKSKRRMKK